MENHSRHAFMPFYPTNAVWPRPQQWSYKRPSADSLDGNKSVTSVKQSSGEEDSDNAINAMRNTLSELAPDHNINALPKASSNISEKNNYNSQLPETPLIGIDDDEQTRLLGSEIILASSQGNYGKLCKLLQVNLRDGNDVENFIESERKKTGVILNTYCSTRDGRTPLMLSTARGDIEAVKLLLFYGADVMAMTKDDKVTAAHFAACHGKSEILALLLQSKATHRQLVQKTMMNNDTILMAAARGNQDANICTLCIQEYIKSHSSTKQMKTVTDSEKFIYDLNKDELGIIGAMNIAALTQPKSDESFPNHNSISLPADGCSIYNKFVNKLLTFLQSSDSDQRYQESPTTPILSPAMDVNKNHGATPLDRSRDETISLLLTPSATLAARSGSICVLREIIDKFPILINRNTNRRRETLLMHAVCAKQVLSTAWLLSEQGCNVLCRDGDGRNILHAAASAESQCLRLLLPLPDEENVEESFMEGEPAAVRPQRMHSGNMYISILANNPSRAIILKENQRLLAGLIEVQDIRGNTPLVTAIRQNSVHAVETLLRAGASVLGGVGVTRMLTTPLHIAAAYSYGDKDFRNDRKNGNDDNSCTEIIELLLKSGSQIDALDENHKVARQIALDKGNVKGAEILAAWARRSYYEDDDQNFVSEQSFDL